MPPGKMVEFFVAPSGKTAFLVGIFVPILIDEWSRIYLPPVFLVWVGAEIMPTGDDKNAVKYDLAQEIHVFVIVKNKMRGIWQKPFTNKNKACHQKSRRDFIVVASYAMGAIGAGAVFGHLSTR